MKKLLPREKLFILCGMSLLIWFRPLINTFSIAITDNRYTQILLILPLSAALIIRGWKAIDFEPNAWTPGVGFLAFALLTEACVRWGHLTVKPDVALAISIIGLVVWWIASFTLCFGLRALHSFCFPLLFLFWVVPVPNFILNHIIAELQRGSALAAQFLFNISSVPLTREGTFLSLPGLTLEVAAECSSIRSSLMLLVTTMLLTHVLLRSIWRKALVIALAVPLSVAKNGLRIYTLGMLSIQVDPAFLHGRLHRQGGILFFLVALSLIFLSIWILQKGEARGYVNAEGQSGVILSSSRLCP